MIINLAARGQQQTSKTASHTIVHTQRQFYILSWKQKIKMRKLLAQETKGGDATNGKLEPAERETSTYYPWHRHHTAHSPITQSLSILRRCLQLLVPAHTIASCADCSQPPLPSHKPWYPCCSLTPGTHGTLSHFQVAHTVHNCEGTIEDVEELGTLRTLLGDVVVLLQQRVELHNERRTWFMTSSIRVRSQRWIYKTATSASWAWRIKPPESIRETLFCFS